MPISKAVSVSLSLLICGAAAESRAPLHPVFPDSILPSASTWLGQAPGGGGDWYVLAQDGRVIRIGKTPRGFHADLFLDNTASTLSTAFEGAYGMAFHPRFKRNGRFYLYYLGKHGDGILSEFVKRPGEMMARAASERKILVEPFPFREATGSTLNQGGAPVFGPDGFLYVPIGDGGPQGDPDNHGQSLETLKGKVLRIDVDGRTGNLPYRIPGDNPFLEAAKSNPKVRAEIWAFGFRQPWRLSFDRGDGSLWLGDVGFKKREEIDSVVRGGNYGWNKMEGTLRTDSAQSGPGAEKWLAPVADYNRVEMKCIVAGFAYYGKGQTRLQGEYLFADYTMGKVWALPRKSRSAGARLLFDLPGIVSIAETREGEPRFLCRNPAGSSVFEMEPETALAGTAPTGIEGAR